MACGSMKNNWPQMFLEAPKKEFFKEDTFLGQPKKELGTLL